MTDYLLFGFVVLCFVIVLGFIFGVIKSNYCEFKSTKNSIDYASEREKGFLQPVITSNDVPNIISNGDGSFYSDKQIKGESHGTLALSNEERVSMANSGWHDTGLVNGHGQPLVQNEKGEILSVCRYTMPSIYSCNVAVDTKINNLSCCGYKN